ncbi:MAG: M50 family metallopeptidase [Chloroflexota bacterium]
MTEVLRTLITIVLFLGILGILVLIHEVGHFVVARLFRVRVLEFGVGFPPRAKVLRNRGETIYTLNWLPIGGFVKLEGEDGDEAGDPRSFVAQGLPRKLAILVAGAAMNLVLAFVIFTGIALTGDPAIGYRIGLVEEGSPAALAGLRVGDVIERVDGRIFGAFGPGDVIGEIRSKAGNRVVLTIRRDGTTLEVAATLRSQADVEAGKGALGVGALAGRTTDDRVTYDPATALGLGVDRTVTATRLIVDGVGQLIEGIVQRPTEPPLAQGPVGIAAGIGDVFFNLGPTITLYLAGFLSANLAVVNILPFPPLDGGRTLMLVIKRFAGQRVSLRAERLTYFVGFAMLLLFLVWVTAFDIARGLGGG